MLKEHLEELVEFMSAQSVIVLRRAREKSADRSCSFCEAPGGFVHRNDCALVPVLRWREMYWLREGGESTKQLGGTGSARGRGALAPRLSPGADEAEGLTEPSDGSRA